MMILPDKDECEQEPFAQKLMAGCLLKPIAKKYNAELDENGRRVSAEDLRKDEIAMDPSYLPTFRKLGELFGLRIHLICKMSSNEWLANFIREEFYPIYISERNADANLFGFIKKTQG